MADKLFADTGIRTVSIIGGANVRGQVDRLRQERPQIVVASPGKVIIRLSSRVLPCCWLGCVLSYSRGAIIYYMLYTYDIYAGYAIQYRYLLRRANHLYSTRI